MLKGAVYKSYLKSVILYAIEAWCPNEGKIDISRRTERFLVKFLCGV